MNSLWAHPMKDLRETLPKRGEPTERGWPDVKGVVVHHTASKANVEAVARYHVYDRRWARIGYHFWIDYDGTVYHLNGVEHVCNSQGGAASESPVPFTQPNYNFVAVVFRGNYTDEPPTRAARVAFEWLWAGLQNAIEIEEDMLFCHRDFKPTACPGDGLAKVVDEVLGRGPRPRDYMPKTVADAQRVLVDLDYDLGEYGPKGDGVDGHWGPATEAALKAATGFSKFDFEASYILGASIVP